MSRRTKIIVQGQKQKGFTLVEMMISMTLGMIAIAGAISMFAGSVKSNGEGLKQIMLNQELRALMEVMARDIPRAGYWRGADGVLPNLFQPMESLGDCITYSYDTTTAGEAVINAPRNEDSFGFRLTNDTLQFRTNSASCDAATNWNAISTSEVIKITFLDFTPTCTNPSTLGTVDCADPQASVDSIKITLNGELVNDTDFKLSLIEKVTTRNAPRLP